MKTPLLAVLLAATTGCGAGVAPAMKATAEPHFADKAPGKARVVFARPSGGCDTFDHAVIVDESGAFVGALAPDTEFAVDVAAGRRAFFVWPGMDLRSEKTPSFQPVGVIDLELREDATRSVDVAVVTPHGGRGHCYRYAVFGFEKSATAADVAPRAGLRVVEPDIAAGQAYLRQKKEVSGAYFLMARDILAQRHAARALASDRSEQLDAAGLK